MVKWYHRNNDRIHASTLLLKCTFTLSQSTGAEILCGLFCIMIWFKLLIVSHNNPEFIENIRGVIIMINTEDPPEEFPKQNRISQQSLGHHHSSTNSWLPSYPHYPWAKCHYECCLLMPTLWFTITSCTRWKKTHNTNVPDL